MSFDLRSIFVYIFGLGLLLILIKLLKSPLKWAARFFLSCVLGVAAIVVFNLIFAKAGLYLPPNPFNAVTIGVFGVPGFAVLLVLASVI